MAKFIVGLKQINIYENIIEAKNRDEAMDKFMLINNQKLIDTQVIREWCEELKDNGKA